MSYLASNSLHIHNIQANYVLWDFDGVLMDSMSVRDEGFRKVLAQYPEQQIIDLMSYHHANGGLSRYVKFRYFFEQIRKEEADEALLRKLAIEFSDIMLDLLIDPALLIKDSLNFIKRHYKHIPMHIVSGSDGDELRFICKQLQIDHYFQSIHGSPIPKKELIYNLLKRMNYQASKTVLIGDSINDYEAAIANALFFLGYNNKELDSRGFMYIDSFTNMIIK